MHAWESIQKSVDYIEENLSREIQIEELANVASLSVFYFQRLFSRLVTRSVREYIKLRRLACACKSLDNKKKRILDIALEYGFKSHITFTKAFKATYGLTPSEYRDKHVVLESFDKPNLLLNYVMVDEGVPLITEGIVLEYHRKTLSEPVNFLGIKGFYRFKPGRMIGEKTGVSERAMVWDEFFNVLNDIPYIPCGRWIGVSYPEECGPDGYSAYFVGAEVETTVNRSDDARLASWQLPAREYIVCQYEAKGFKALIASQGKMMKFTRFWLKKHGLIADGFFPEVYYNHLSSAHYAYMEMWIPFKEREK